VLVDLTTNPTSLLPGEEVDQPREMLLGKTEETDHQAENKARQKKLI
jgi:hypothetical protein